ncbi:MAG: response regulator [Chloroflexi bacterium]|nr:response regulator [Chloroflexota bacterium]MCC6896982.1 response regulator [Anaerolineae bacterium]
MNRPSQNQGEGEIITILLVDDIPEARENIKKMIAFEPDMKVVGSAGTGREGVALAKELKPNIVIMDINMPDMDGIQATAQITQAVPTTAVIMMSVQSDQDYLQRAMLVGARFFLSKPVSMDDLYNTIRSVYTQHKQLAEQYRTMVNAGTGTMPKAVANTGTGNDDNRAGHIVIVYSPQGGAGCTTIATNLASGLMREGTRALLVDADLQFGDVGVFLNLQGQSTIVDLARSVADLDTELFDNIVVTHDSGLKVLMAPARPAEAFIVQQDPTAVATIIQKVANHYDFIVVDTGRHMDETLGALFDIASKIVLVTTPTLAGVKNVRFVLDEFDQLGYSADKTTIVLNRVPQDRNLQKFAIPTEKISKFLKRPVEVEIPQDELTALTAMSKGVLIVAQRDRSRSPVKEFMQLADTIYTKLMGEETEQEAKQQEAPRSIFGSKLFGRTN